MVTTIRWGHEALECVFDIAEDGVVRLTRFGEQRPGASLPLGEVTAANHVRTWPHLSDMDAADVVVQRLYPAAGSAVARWSPGTAELTLTLPTAPCAVLYRLTTRGVDG